MLLQTIGQRNLHMPFVGLVDLMHLIQLLLYPLGLAAAEVAFHALHLHDLAAAGYLEAPLCTLVGLHLGHETILFFLIISIVVSVVIILVESLVEFFVKVFVEILWKIRIVKLIRLLNIGGNRRGGWRI